MIVNPLILFSAIDRIQVPPRPGGSHDLTPGYFPDSHPSLLLPLATPPTHPPNTTPFCSPGPLSNFQFPKGSQPSFVCPSHGLFPLLGHIMRAPFSTALLPNLRPLQPSGFWVLFLSSFHIKDGSPSTQCLPQNRRWGKLGSVFDLLCHHTD